MGGGKHCKFWVAISVFEAYHLFSFVYYSDLASLHFPTLFFLICATFESFIFILNYHLIFTL